MPTESTRIKILTPMLTDSKMQESATRQSAITPKVNLIKQKYRSRTKFPEAARAHNLIRAKIVHQGRDEKASEGNREIIREHKLGDRFEVCAQIPKIWR